MKGAFEMIEEANRNFGGPMEADIVLNADQEKYMNDFREHEHDGDKERQRREALTGAFRKWNNARIPYKIDASIDARGRQAIADSIAVYAAKTCINVVPREPEDLDYVVFKKLGGCFSFIGKVGGAQDISIGEGCQFVPVVLHEIMHALGFFHEQSRLDRDDHVELVTSNIEPRFLNQFDKHPQGIADNLGSPYDYTGIMHYGNTAFAIDRSQPTLISKRVRGERLGGSQTLTDIDIAQLNKYYNCPVTTDEPTTTKATTSTTEPTTTEAATTTTERTTTTEEPTTTRRTTTTKATETPTTEETTTATTKTDETTTTTEKTTTEKPTTRKPVTTSEPICRDSHLCAQFQRFAPVICPRFSFFRQQCPVMCDSCSDITTANRCSRFSNRRGITNTCRFRARRGYCTSRYYQSWMIDNCARACCEAGHLFE